MRGLVRKPQYEEVLNLAIKDATSQHGILSVPLQRYATELVNSPLFQRIQATLGDSLEADQRRVIEQRTFENQLHHVAVEARVPRDDLQWLVENLQRPAPTPQHRRQQRICASTGRVWPRRWTGRCSDEP